jgi:hypothetical protein
MACAGGVLKIRPVVGALAGVCLKNTPTTFGLFTGGLIPT